MGSNGSLETEKLKLLSRTYAQAIAGTPVRMSFELKDASFELEYKATIVSAPTEIYLNEAMHYPMGFDTVIEPSNCVNVETHTNRVLLHLTIAETESCLGRDVKVRVTAKTAPTLLV